MAVEQRTRTPSEHGPVTTHVPTPGSILSWPLVQAVIEALPEGGGRAVAVAPGRLDVMGGSATYTGSFSVSTLVARHVAVAIAPRGDDTIWIGTVAEANGVTPCLYKPSDWNGAEIKRGAAGATAGSTEGSKAPRGDVVAAALRAMYKVGVLQDADMRMSLCVSTQLDDYGDLGQDAAVIAATVAVVCQSLGITLDADKASDIALLVSEFPSLPPISPADVLAVLTGDPGSLTQLQSCPPEISGSFRIPDELAIVGVDCGVAHPHAGEKYVQARTTVAMGTILVDRIIRHDGLSDLLWEGHLSRLSVTDFVERFRDRLPTKISGQQFLERFGAPDDVLADVNPDRMYKLRSRTEHHIYEHFRALQFVPCLSRGIRNRDERAIREAGELMYGSHWSYGQRCGLGSIETDLLVSLIRRHGTDVGIYGAKITGWGCGGAVAVLMQESAPAREALQAAISDYEKSSGNKTVILSQGAGANVAALAVQV